MRPENAVSIVIPHVVDRPRDLADLMYDVSVYARAEVANSFLTIFASKLLKIFSDSTRNISLYLIFTPQHVFCIITLSDADHLFAATKSIESIQDMFDEITKTFENLLTDEDKHLVLRAREFCIQRIQ